MGCLLWVQITVWCCYNAVDFLKIHHKRHSIARPLGRDMGCLLRCCNSATDFLQNHHKWHPIARPLGRDMGCLFLVPNRFIFCTNQCNDVYNIMLYRMAEWHSIICHILPLIIYEQHSILVSSLIHVLLLTLISDILLWWLLVSSECDSCTFVIDVQCSIYEVSFCEFRIWLMFFCCHWAIFCIWGDFVSSAWFYFWHWWAIFHIYKVTFCEFRVRHILLLLCMEWYF